MLAGPETTKIVREKQEDACRRFAMRIAASGFSRSKKRFGTRRREHTVDVIHLHRSGSSYGGPINFKVSFRVHFAIRVLNDTFEGVALNGPMSDPTRMREGRYHHSFNAKSGDMFDRCIDDLFRFVTEQGEPWFSTYREPSRLLTADSPLEGTARLLLQSGLAGDADSSHVTASLKLLGIRP
ncbi:hypothetical protein [Verrucomicrobium sp. BvORR034]|uniref:hypothetical protein n=1 Tax=Verrucomicrobium sp. BvORR034 TaxID=1396418 RepID=UPI000678ED75|nr:hypothetical protein [Verrucomicrobium sp. BvORR034]